MSGNELSELDCESGDAVVDRPQADQSASVTSSFQVLAVMTNQDLSLEETAEHFGVSIDEVVEHMNAVKRKLGVPTLEQAVYQAIKRGYIASPGYTF